MSDKMIVVATEIKQIALDEGLRLEPYIDTEGYLTIGYGTCIAHVGDIAFDPVWRIDEDTAHFLLRKECCEIYDEMKRKWPWFESKPLGVKCIMLNMAYNLGVPRLALFSQTLGAIAANDYEKASTVMLLNTAGDDKSPWYKQVGDRAKRLSDRLRG